MSYSGSRGPPAIEGMTSLKVDNLTYRTNVDDLKRVFQKFGDVGDIYIPRQKDGESRGFAFVRFYEKRDAEDAMDAIDGSVLDGREIRVQNAKYGRPSYNARRSSQSRGRYNDRYDRNDGSRYRRSYSPRRRRSRSRSYSPRRRSPVRRRRSRSRSRSPRRRQQSRSPEQVQHRSNSRSPRRQKSHSPSQSPKRRSASPAVSKSPSKERSKSGSPEADD